jgi:thiol-disulfide isomerase/thioredoxin
MKAFLVLIFTVFLALGLTAQSSESTMMKADDSTMMKADDSTMMKADSSAYDLKGLGPQVIPFTSEKAAWSLAKKQTVVYFFAATWCPDCQATYRDVKANYAKLPRELVLVFVDYDKAKDLKAKYGVVAQHTFVVVGPKGEAKKSWSGAKTVAEIADKALSM